MALYKSITDEKGVITTYHRVANATLRNSELSCILDSYVSQDYRELEKPADSHYYSFSITVEEEESMGIRQICYKKIKEMPEWEGAVDC